MNFTKIRSLSLAVVIGLSVTVGIIGLLGMISPVLAEEQELTGPERLFPSMVKPEIDFTVVFTDPVEYLVVYNLAGNPVGEGNHWGAVRCRGDNCNKNTQILFTVPLTDPVEVEYRYSNRVALDREARRAMVQGVGILYNGHQKERFSFVATFEDNRDGTVFVRYEASRPDASFVIPNSSGKFEIINRS
jgi:hypothetical protein